MSALILAASLASSQQTIPGAQTPQTPVMPTVAAPKTPPAPQPPVTRPPAEQMPAPTPTPQSQTEPAPLPRNDTDKATAIALLDRIEKLVNEALEAEPGKAQRKSGSSTSKSDPVGTSGSLIEKAGKVTIDRAALAEIRAEVSLLKTMLQR